MSTRTRGEARHRATPDARARTRRRTALLSVPALVGALSGIVAPAQAAVGDFSIDFVGAAPYSYDHLVGGGAFDDRTVGKNADIVESLEAVDFACGDVVTYLSQVVVDDTAQADADAPQTIELDYEFLMDTTGTSGVAIGDITYVGVNYAPVVDLIPGEDDIDQGNIDDRGSVATLIYENRTGPLFTAKSVLQGTVEVTDLERNEEVIVRIDVRLYCQPGSDPTGNLQGAITAGRLTYVNGTTPVTGNISVGNQTVPFLQFGSLHWPELVIDKTVTDAGGTCPGVESVEIDSGQTVTYCYAVSNPSNTTNPPGAALYDISAVTDDNRTPGDTSDDFAVTLTGLTDVDGDGQLDDLAAGGIAYAQTDITVTAAMTGTYTNTASVSGYTFPGDTTLPLSDTDTADVVVTFIPAPAISIDKTTNGSDGPTILLGQPVTWSYVVTNTGNVALENVSVTDDQGVSVSCPVTTLAVAESMTCTADGTAVAGAYGNIGTASGDYGGMPVTGTDPSSYFGAAPQIEIEKSPDTQTVIYGQPATFTIVVTNTGNVDLTDVAVTDALAPTCDAAIGNLAAGVSTSYDCTYQNVTADLTNVAVASGMYGDTPVSHEDDAAVVVDILPDITVSKTASPLAVPETGGDVTFTIVVTNSSTEPFVLSSLDDDVFGDLDGVGTCDVPQTIAAGGDYTCAISKNLASDSLAPHTDWVTAAGADEQGNPDSATDDATVTFTDVAPDIEVTKTASPSSVPETGGDVTFTFQVENIGDEDVTLTSLTDDMFGDLNGQGDCVTGGIIPVGGSYTCSLTVFLSADDLVDHYNVTTAVGADDDGNTDTDTDDETVTFDDVMPAITVTKTADPASVPETGDYVDFTYLVENTGPEDVTLTSLLDDRFGDLNGMGTCALPQEIPVGGSYSCIYSVFLASDTLAAHTNVVTATAVDDDGTEATATDDETVTFTDVAPRIEVIKSANPTSVPETGGNVTFTFLVNNLGFEDVTLTSLTDTVFGDLAGKGTCELPQTILVGGSYSCEYTVNLSSDSLAAHTNVVTATAVDDDGTTAADDDDETVTFTDVAPDISITKSASPTSVPETGGDVTFTFVVTNIGVEDVTLTSLSDTVFGDLNGQGDCVTGGLIPVGGSYSCSITQSLSSDSLTGHYNVTTAVGTDDDGTTDTATDDETVTFDDVAPAIRVTKTADPTLVPETGGDVTFTFLVENIGVEDVTLTSLTDSVFGDLNGQGTCAVPQIILIGGSYSCTLTEWLASDSLSAHTDVVTAKATDDDGTEATDDDDETVMFDNVAPMIEVLKTANPTHVPETGGDVEFTFLVTNTGQEDVTLTALIDTVFGDLNGQGTCATPQTILIGESYSCSITELLAADDLVAHVNVTTADAVDDDGTTATDDDDETVTFDDVLPDIMISKSALPTSVPETGADVEFTLIITNGSLEDVTIDSLVDSDFDLAVHCPDVVGTVLPFKGSVSCIFTEWVAGDFSGISHENTAAVIASDDDGNSDTASDDETVTFTDVPPDISVTKTAAGAPASVPETGGNVTFTFTVVNHATEAAEIVVLTDDKFGDLTGDADCQVGTVLAAGASCSVEATFAIPAGDYPGAHVNTFVATATDGDGNFDRATDDETVTYTDVLPDIAITKTASPTSVPETGGSVEFTVVVTNGSLEAATIDSLVDSDFDLAGHCPDAVGTVLGSGASYSCTFTELIAGDVGGADHLDTATVVVSDGDGNSDTASDDATVTFTDVLPDIAITKTASPTSVPETGGNVEFRVVVTNDSLEAATIDSLVDSDFDLAGHCPDAVGTVLGSGASYSCTFTEYVAGDFESGISHENTATVVASDGDGNTDTASDDATVDFTDVTASIDVEKYVSVDGGTTWDDADSPTGPYVTEGGTAEFKFVVTNTGSVALSGISLIDSDFDLAGCTIPSTLAAAASFECIISTTAISGQHTDTATASGSFTDGAGTLETGTDTDDANYYGMTKGQPSIQINSLTIVLDGLTTVTGEFAITDESTSAKSPDGYLVALHDYGVRWEQKLATKKAVFLPILPDLYECTYSIVSSDYVNEDWSDGDTIMFDEDLTIGYSCTFDTGTLVKGASLKGTAYASIWGRPDMEFTYSTTVAIPKR